MLVAEVGLAAINLDHIPYLLLRLLHVCLPVLIRAGVRQAEDQRFPFPHPVEAGLAAGRIRCTQLLSVLAALVARGRRRA